MLKKRYTLEVKNLALKLIAEGATYRTVREKLGVAKSTLSLWAKGQGRVPDRAKQLAHLAYARKLALATIAIGKSQRISQALSNAEHIARSVPLHSVEVSKSLLAMLYWAEGGKQEGNFKFTNTDPQLVALFLSLLRKSYEIDETRLYVALQIHSYHEREKTINFWSKKLKIPASQFWKVYLKPRSGKREYRRNFYGICNLHYASTPIQREVLALGQALAKQYP